MWLCAVHTVWMRCFRLRLLGWLRWSSRKVQDNNLLLWCASVCFQCFVYLLCFSCCRSAFSCFEAKSEGNLISFRWWVPACSLLLKRKRGSHHLYLPTSSAETIMSSIATNWPGDRFTLLSLYLSLYSHSRYKIEMSQWMRHPLRIHRNRWLVES
jgi:hypothetical protein